MMRTSWKAKLPSTFKSVAKIQRARLFELGGSVRYSMPGLNDLDRKVLRYLPPHGAFLEIGANDGYSQSNTYYLERVSQWHGILIEPLPSLYRICSRARPKSICVNVACVGPEGPDSIEMVDLNLMSVALGLQASEEEERRLSGGRGKRVKVPTRTLSEVITQADEGRLDFMSIDVEGAELEVLSGLDLTRHTPGHLLIETKYPDRVESLLSQYMAPVSQLSFHDYLFAAITRT